MRRLTFLAALLVLLVAGSGAASTDLTLTLVAQDATTVTWGWIPVPGADGYSFLWDGQTRKSWTWDGSRSTVRVSSALTGFKVRTELPGPVGVAPAPAPPPPPPAPPPPPPPPPPPVANEFVAPSGLDTNPCSEAAPCLTLNRAYQVASCTDRIGLAPGSYGYQRFVRNPPLCTSSTRIVVFPLAGAGTTTISFLDVGSTPFGVAPPRNLELDDLTITGSWRIWNNANDIVVRNVKAGDFQTIGPSNVLIQGGEIGPCDAANTSVCSGNILEGTGVTFDGVRIHDITSSNLTTNHVDAIFVRACIGCAITHSKFYGNMVDNIRVQNCCLAGGDPPNSNLTIENNWFGQTYAFSNTNLAPRQDGIDIDTATPGLLIRNNSFNDSGPSFGNAGSTSGNGARVVNNLMTNFPCASGVTYSHNLFVPSGSSFGNLPCSLTDRSFPSFAAFLYANAVNTAFLDYHLGSGSPGIAAGDATDCPADTIDGDQRPPGVCNAGAA